MGQSADGMYLVETAADVQQLHVRTPAELAYVTQTTLSVDDAAQVIAALKERFPKISGPRKDDICYATQNRLVAVKALTMVSEVVIVVGSKSSSNSNRLREVAELRGNRAYLVDHAEQIDPAWLAGAERVGVTAGASAPEVLVQNVVDHLSGGDRSKLAELDGTPENVTFALPRELQS